ncbi:MAG: carbohydrate-binding protein [Luteolibacter sp.]
MEKLDRGVIAIRSSSSAALVSWRVLGLDAASTTFNLYRSTNGGTATKLNATPLTVSNYSDTTAATANAYTYYIRPVIGGVEQAASISFTLAANLPVQYCHRIPLQGAATGYSTQFVWPGDLDGDGEYDFVIDRLPDDGNNNQLIEAYTSKGQKLWTIDMGPGSRRPPGVENQPAEIDVGHWDGVTVYDLDGDGRAEVILKVADGVVFGGGGVVSGLGTNVQAISVVSGMTGIERARTPVPTTYLANGAMGAHMGIAYLNGTTPSLVVKMKNRQPNGFFNLVALAYDFAANNTITKKWEWHRGTQDLADNHQIRIFDVDQNGTDEFIDGGYCLNANGTLRYKVGLNNPNVVHGDRFAIGDFNPGRPGLEAMNIQQNNPNNLLYLLYDASTGATIHSHYSATPEDTARGLAADLDPNYPGYEYWSFHGLHRVDTGAVVSTLTPYPNFRIWWDGDVLSEALNAGKVEKYLYASSPPGLSRLFTVTSAANGGVQGTVGARGAPMFYGDIMGDWREEIISFNADWNELIICSTPLPTTTRLYTLAHNPAYRASMTTKGYMQSHYVDYYLGNGMSTPPAPNITYTPVTLQSELDNKRGGYAFWESTNTGYTGSGYTNFTVPGGWVQWSRVSGAAGGSRTITFRYANGSGGPLTGNLIVNGVTQSITFPATSNWNTWATMNVSVNMNAGATNTIKVQSTGADLAHIDYLALP